MERVIRLYETHADQARADRDALRAMTPQERLDRALELIARYPGEFR